MPYYTVEWKMGFEAKSPAMAALAALEVQRDPGSDALYFTVMDGPVKIAVDLLSWTISDWQQDVAAGNTVLGYKDWVQHQWEADQV